MKVSRGVFGESGLFQYSFILVCSFIICIRHLCRQSVRSLSVVGLIELHSCRNRNCSCFLLVTDFRELLSLFVSAELMERIRKEAYFSEERLGPCTLCCKLGILTGTLHSLT